MELSKLIKSLKVTKIYHGITENNSLLHVVTIPIFLISDFKILVISKILNRISRREYEIWQHLVHLAQRQCNV